MDRKQLNESEELHSRTAAPLCWNESAEDVWVSGGDAVWTSSLESVIVLGMSSWTVTLGKVLQERLNLTAGLGMPQRDAEKMEEEKKKVGSGDLCSGCCLGNLISHKQQKMNWWINEWVGKKNIFIFRKNVLRSFTGS